MNEQIDVIANAIETQHALEDALWEWLGNYPHVLQPDEITVGLTDFDDYYKFVTRFRFGEIVLFWDGAKSDLKICDTAYHPHYADLVLDALQAAIYTWRLLRGENQYV